MTFSSYSAELWPYIFILLAGAIPTGIWRWLGVLAVGNLRDDSEWIIAVRCISTALIAAVVAQFIFAPTGSLADVPLTIRIVAAAGGFGAFLATNRLWVGIVFGEALLLSGALWFGG